jgi:hypothetical protein
VLCLILNETVAKPFSKIDDIGRKRIATMISVGFGWRFQMTELVQALSRFGGTNVEIETLKLLAIFCGAGLLVSIVFATYGLDLSPGFF